MIPRTEERAHTILLKTLMQQREEGRALAGQAIMPGMLIEIDSTSTDLPRTPEIVKKHATSGGRTRVLIALEDFYQGKGILDAIADDDVVQYQDCQPGDVFMARVAEDFVATPGAELQSGGDGTFIAQSGAGIALVEVEDNVDFTDELAEDDPDAPGLPRLCRVKVI